MPRLLRILRRTCKITGWLACGLSALLLVATIILWVRSLGHVESWRYNRFEPRPDWRMPGLAGGGISRAWFAGAIHGRLWLGLRTEASMPELQPGTEYWRNPISADEAQQHFDSRFQPGERRWAGGNLRAWRFAGAGLSSARTALDPLIGRPRIENFTLALPFWMLAILFALWPGVRLLRWLFRKQRYAAGLCPHCGYDLRATPQRCPECGKNVPASCHT